MDTVKDTVLITGGGTGIGRAYRGAFNALRVVEVQQNTGQPELLHPRHVIRFTAGGQDVKALAF